MWLWGPRSPLEGWPSPGRDCVAVVKGRSLTAVPVHAVSHCGWWLFPVRSCSDGFLDTSATPLKGQQCQPLSRVAEGMVDW